MKNKTLVSAISKVMLNNSNHPFYSIELKLLTTDGSLTYSPLAVETLYIAQDFVYSYADQIKVVFPIAMADYAKLYQVYNKLTAQLIIKVVDRSGVKAKVEPILNSKYFVVFDDFKDPSKMMTDVKYRTQPSGKTISLTLVEPELYHLRHMPIQGIYKDSTMSGVIGHIVEGLQISEAYIQAPDNVHQYEHIVVPPYKEFKDVFHLLQDRYGVYMLGLNNYFTNSKLYIWPIYDTNPKAPYFAKILQADDGAYAGASSFHQEETTGVTLVVNNSPNAQDRSLIAGEHIGNSAQFLRTSSQVDGIITQDANGVMTYNEDNVITVGLNNKRLGRSDANNTTFVHQTDNLFAVASELARNNYIAMSFNWPQAKPWLIKPGTAVRYYSDEDGQIGKRTGLIDTAFYTFQRADRGATLTYTCKGVLAARLDPTEQITTSVS